LCLKLSFAPKKIAENDFKKKETELRVEYDRISNKEFEIKQELSRYRAELDGNCFQYFLWLILQNKFYKKKILTKSTKNLNKINKKFNQKINKKSMK
jgi:hypothetical protein